MKNSIIERIVVPERKFVENGFLKHEWLIRLNSSAGPKSIILSLSPQTPYFAYLNNKGPKAKAVAPLPPFIQKLNQVLKGKKIQKITSIENDRIIKIDLNFNEEYFSLYIFLIPTKPNAVLTNDSNQSIASINSNPPNISQLGNRKADRVFSIRKIIDDDPEQYARYIENELSKNESLFREKRVLNRIQQELKQTDAKFQKIEKSLHYSKSEPDWKTLADLIKSQLHSIDDEKWAESKIFDYRTEEWISFPKSKKSKSPQAQMTDFYHKAKRSEKRFLEQSRRKKELESELDRLKSLLNTASKSSESALELEAAVFPPKPTQVLKKSSKLRGWKGKTFLALDGSTIHVGRNRTENQALTFKIANGNDTWMHVRGRPGCHTIIKAVKNKSIPLSTLLDAAQLTAFYSGLTDSSKIEIDYVQRKNVKPIKGSEEVHYVGNKTLIIDSDRIAIDKIRAREILK